MLTRYAPMEKLKVPRGHDFPEVTQQEIKAEDESTGPSLQSWGLPGAASQLSLCSKPLTCWSLRRTMEAGGEDERHTFWGKRIYLLGLGSTSYLISSGWSVMFLIERLGYRERQGGQKEPRAAVPSLRQQDTSGTDTDMCTWGLLGWQESWSGEAWRHSSQL